MRKIAARLYVRRWRKEKRLEGLDETHGEESAGGEVSAASRIDLDGALQALSPTERMCISLCYGAGLSHAEAAEAMNAPLGTVKSHVKRGLDKLRVRLAQPSDAAGKRDHG